MKDFPPDQMDEMRRLHAGASKLEEAGAVFFRFPVLALPHGCVPCEVEAMLCPEPRDGYESRLFFSEEVKGPKPLNWNSKGVRIGEKMWHAFSWKTPAGLRLTQMVAAHLQALK